MKRILVVATIILLLALVASAEDFWNLRTTAHGTIVRFSDDFGVGKGLGARFLFGARHGVFDLGFEVEKWFRSYDTFDRDMDSLIAIGNRDQGGLDRQSPYADNEQDGLSFSMIFRYRLYNLGLGGVYSGTGVGFCFISHRYEDPRQSQETGFWDVFMVASKKTCSIILTPISKEKSVIFLMLMSWFPIIRNILSAAMSGMILI
jgi:hypothetical protein